MTRVTDINVLVTGMGPYPDTDGRIDQNTSYLLTTLLPSTIAPNTAYNPSSTRINILTLPSYVKSEYSYVRQLCKTLHQEHAQDVDLFIHLGEARGWNFMTIERVAYKQGMTSVWWSRDQEKGYYMITDDAGMTVEDAGPCPWDNVPMGLRSALDVDNIADGAKVILKTRYQFGKRPGPTALDQDQADQEGSVTHEVSLESGAPIEIKPHNEGGPYLCGFINYESLANCYTSKRTPNVLFCHVPGEADPANLRRTGDGILAIIVSATNEVVRQKE